MLESPLKKNKHSYPIDFSIKKKEVSKNSTKKYEVISFEDVNPQQSTNQKASMVLNKFSINQLPLQTNKKSDEKEILPVFQTKQQNIFLYHQLDNQNTQIFQVNNNFTSQQNEQPLKEIKKKANQVVIDSVKLKNPRIQINQQISISTNQKTLQPNSPQKNEISEKIKVIGRIHHQQFLFQQQKNPPLQPEVPFNIVQKNLRRNSLLQKLNYAKTVRKSHEFQVQSKKYPISDRKVIHPENFSYANRLLSTSEDKLQKGQKIQKFNSSFQMKKSDNIIFFNNTNLDGLSFNLSNLQLSDGIPPQKIQNKKVPQKMISQISSSYPINGTKFFTKNPCTNDMNYQPNQITQLKSQINLLTKNRLKNRSYQGSKINQTQRQLISHELHSKKSKKEEFFTEKPKKINKKPTKKLQITYHVPLTSLKKISRLYLSSPEIYSLAFKVPKIFMEYDLFRKGQSKEQVHENGLYLFESLKINSKDMQIKRYSNCIMFICGTIALMWYYNGKRYLGGWQYDYLDEGSRHGLGLEWEPDMYIYYGQFRNNKRHGLGLMKEGPENVKVGYWNEGKYIGASQHQVSEQQQDESFMGLQANQSKQNYSFQQENYPEYFQ